MSDRRSELLAAAAQYFPSLGGQLPGDYSSPIPSAEDIAQALQTSKTTDPSLSIELRASEQRALLEELRPYLREAAFSAEPHSSQRYYTKNQWFPLGDALLLQSVLRHFRPRRIIEVGSGYSSAVMLDTCQQFFRSWPHITLIEPTPS